MNSSVIKKESFLISILILVLVFYASTIASVPPPTENEAMMVEPGWNYYSEGHLTSNMFGNTLESENGFTGQGNFLHFIFGLSLKFFGLNVLSGRMVCLLFGIFLIFYLYNFVSKSYDKYAAFFCCITLLTSTAFFYSIHLCRASIFLSFFHIIAVCNLWRYSSSPSDRNSLKSFIIGLSVVFTLMFHLSGIISVLAVFISFLFINRKKLISKNVFMFLLGCLVSSLLWLLVHMYPLGFDLFLEKFTDGVSREPDSGIFNSMAWKYFFVSKLNFFYLFAFLVASYIIFSTKDKLSFFVKYLVLYIAISVYFVEVFESHKAVIFLPIISICIGVIQSKFFLFLRTGNKKKTISLITLLVLLSVSAGFSKFFLYTKRSTNVDYYTYLNEIFKVVPAGKVVLGQPNLWFGLTDRNKLLGGTYFMGRSLNSIKGRAKLRQNDNEPPLTNKAKNEIFEFFNEKSISYIVASEDMYDMLRLNGILDKSFKGRIEEIKKIDTLFYGREIFEKGTVRIYKINN